jgi:hypothetical protein
VISTARVLAVVLIGLLGANFSLSAPIQNSESQIEVADLNRQIRSFLEREISAHVADIKTLDPPPERVVGALTTGEFSWGTFMRTLSAYSRFIGSRTILGHDVPRMIGRMAQIELGQGGKTWAQLYAAMALQSFGTDLDRNALWQSLSPEQKQAYRVLLDPGRFYDPKTHRLIDLPDNYFGVAARIAAIDYQLGLEKDRASLDDLLDHAARQFTDGALFADDAPATGRFDRYSNEYARAIYDAAKTAGREDITKAIEPSLKEQMRLWWDLLSPDGYGYPWGRSLGAISYMDTMEIAAFLGTHPELQPAPLAQLGAAYFAAWSWLRHDFNETTHLLRVFDFGRGDYDYITKQREWQQTTTFLGKAISAHESFMNTLEKGGITVIQSRLKLEDVSRFEVFRNESNRKFGVWVVRRGNLHFALPFVTGPREATSDYQPAPHGLPGFAVPVQKIYPCLVPFLQLEDGPTIAAADGADEIYASADGLTLTAKWREWVVPGAKAGETIDPGLVTEVTWSIVNNVLSRTEMLTALKDVGIRRLWMAVPTRADHIETFYADNVRTDRLISTEGVLEICVRDSNWPIRVSAFAPGDDPLGRGDRGALSLHLLLETDAGFSLLSGESRRWRIDIACRPAAPD